MNSHAKWLRQAAQICLKANLVNVANTCDQAAAEIERLERVPNTLSKDISDLLKRSYDELPDPEFIPEHEKEVRVRALRAAILQAVAPTSPVTQADIEWAQSPERQRGDTCDR